MQFWRDTVNKGTQDENLCKPQINLMQLAMYVLVQKVEENGGPRKNQLCVGSNC